MCIVTLCGNVAPVSVTPRMSTRNSVSSNTRRPMPTIRGSGEIEALLGEGALVLTRTASPARDA